MSNKRDLLVGENKPLFFSIKSMRVVGSAVCK